VLERGDDLALVVEALEGELLVEEGGLEELDCALAVEGPLPGAKHGGHAPAVDGFVDAELLQELVAEIDVRHGSWCRLYTADRGEATRPLIPATSLAAVTYPPPGERPCTGRWPRAMLDET